MIIITQVITTLKYIYKFSILGVKIEAIDNSEIETIEFAEESDPELIENLEPGPSNALSLPNNPGTFSNFFFLPPPPEQVLRDKCRKNSSKR